MHLVLLDLNMGGVPDHSSLHAVLDVPTNGFHIGDHLDAADADPPLDFRFKPLVALVTSFSQQVLAELPVRSDESVGSCDAVLPKPLDPDAMRVLMQGCGV